MAMSGGRDDGEPMMEMNTTPLIDVMLVLLIMFIITIPIQTHAVKIDLPQGDTKNQIKIDPVKNRLKIDPYDHYFWNDREINPQDLRGILAETKRLPTEPILEFQPDPQTRYLTVDTVLAIIKASRITKLGFVGNEDYAYF